MWQRWNQGTKLFETSVDTGASWTPLPVAYVDRSNLYVGPQYIQQGPPSLYPEICLYDPTRPADYRKFRIVTSGGTAYLQFVNDAETAARGNITISDAGSMTISGGLTVSSGLTVSNGLTVNSGDLTVNPGNLAVGGIEARNHVRAQAYLYDLGRGYPIGYPVDGGAISFSNCQWQSTIVNEYYVMGNFLFYNFGWTVYIPATTGALTFTIPAGYTSTTNASGMCGYTNIPGATCWYISPGVYWLTLLQKDGSAFPAGFTMDVRGQAMIRIS